MTWHPDVPDLPMNKPHELERLEQLPHSILNAMTRTEIDEKIRDAADSLAQEYHRVNGEQGSLSECVLIVGGALSQTGNSISGHLGQIMVGTSTEAATHACADYYHEHPSPNEIEY